MKPRVITLTIALTTALVVTGCSASTDPTASDTPTPEPTVTEARDGGPFDFVATTVDGEQLDGETLKHRDVVLWFWAPWCPTCRVEGRDHVSEVIAQLPDDVELIGIVGRSDDQAAMEEFLEWTGTGDAVHVIDADGSIWMGFDVVLQPAFYFVNDDGSFERAGAGLSTEDIMEHVAWLTES